ncbi:MAG: DnaJ domain-containing protein [Bacteroidetes bacterium]|nr:DnaJ domain-containing protein [Bacteroidota bacterium]
MEYDYYKLLGLKTGSDFPEVRKAYLQAARRYHPDYNPDNPAAEQMMKVLNQGYELLSNPGKKEVYDAMLYAHYRKAERPVSKTSDGISREARRQRARAILREREVQFVVDYQRKYRSLRLQLFLLPLLVLSAPLYAFFNWFADEASYDHLLILLSFALFIASLLRLAALLWRYLNVRHILRQRKFHDAWLYGTTLAVLGLTPWLVYEGAQWRRQYHLAHYAATTTFKVESLNHGLLRYSFMAGTRRIEKLERGILWDLSETEQSASACRVRYSIHDPRIAEIILVSPNP